MTKKAVIAGSVSLKDKIEYWKIFWEQEGYQVIDYPVAIAKESFLEDYPQVHKDFFQNIIESDILFVMNEDKNDIKGYLGVESFAEMCFGVIQNLINDKNIKIILLQMPEKNVQSYDEISLWLKLGWIKILNK
ncbi:MAG TPA: hypothetical protein EYG99_02700 [Candidatus Pacebacteria bacterium]|nr:hypothetical protein [Candidatus Paceibacterota bacterium]